MVKHLLKKDATITERIQFCAISTAAARGRIEGRIKVLSEMEEYIAIEDENLRIAVLTRFRTTLADIQRELTYL